MLSLTRSPGNASALLAEVTAALRSRDFELDVNEASGVVAAFNRARAAGVGAVAIADFAAALVDVLKRQLAATFEAVDDDEDVDDENVFDDDAGCAEAASEDEPVGSIVHDPSIARQNARRAFEAMRKPRRGANLRPYFDPACSLPLAADTLARLPAAG